VGRVINTQANNDNHASAFHDAKVPSKGSNGPQDARHNAEDASQENGCKAGASTYKDEKHHTRYKQAPKYG